MLLKKKTGMPETSVDRLPDKFWKYYNQYKDKQINTSEFSRLMDCTRASVYKYIKIAETE